MMKHLSTHALAAASAVLLLAGCGATEEQTAPEAVAPITQQSELLAACQDTEELAEAAEHSCHHAEYGPFESVTAAQFGGPSFVDVSAAHTAYNVTLPAIAYQQWTLGYAGSVIFTPEESTEYAFLTSGYRAVRIVNAATNEEVGQECRYNVPEEVCGSLRTAVTADLEGGIDYRVDFVAVVPQAATFLLIIEEIGHGGH
ncbi:TerD family protein [Corallococcus soli]|uniref:TerD family protein n=1 Tax=Corallococcus soli TaxID=2710757 RepID=UPI001D0407DE|nr:TerD family protein [Corallococcus soli]